MSVLTAAVAAGIPGRVKDLTVLIGGFEYPNVFKFRAIRNFQESSSGRIARG